MPLLAQTNVNALAVWRKNACFCLTLPTLKTKTDTHMNRLTATITLALALLRAAAAGAQPGGEKLLRDDATGEWLIGFFADYAVYDNRFWQYAARDGGSMTLCCGGDTIGVSLAGGSVEIGGRSHKCSELTGSTMPYYPEADPTPFTDRIPPRLDSVTVRFVMPKGSGTDGAELSYNKFFYDSESIYIAPDSTGRAEVTLPAPCTKELTVKLPGLPGLRGRGWTFIPLYPEPGDTVTAFIDHRRGRYFVMGSNARLSNELLCAPDPKKVYVSYGENQRLTPEGYIGKAGKMLSESLAQTDSIARRHPTLSAKWAALQRAKARNAFAYGLTQNAYNRPRTEILGLPTDTLMRGGYFNPTVPFMADDDMLCIFADYVGLTRLAGQGSTPHLLRKAARELEREGQLSLTDAERALIEEVAAIDSVTASMPADSAQRYYEEHMDVLKAASALYYKPAINKWFRTEDAKGQMRIISGMGLDRLTEDMSLAWLFVTDLENTGESFTPEQADMITRNVATPALRDYIMACSKKFADYANAAPAQAAQPADTARLATLTDGREILDCITAPYRGRIIYVDVWGTWCVPCKEEMKHVPEMKKALEGMDVVYLYLCSRSSDESWRANIARFGLGGKDCVHYNLPQAQQAAVEAVLGVGGYPTYKVIDRQGRIVPGTPPRPSDPYGLKEYIKKIGGKSGAE